jgi:hypothetical protein
MWMSINIPDRVKEKMDRLPDVDWSVVACQAFSVRLAAEGNSRKGKTANAGVFVTLPELADKLNLPAEFLAAESKASHIPCLIVGGEIRFHPQSVERALLKAQHMKKKSESVD